MLKPPFREWGVLETARSLVATMVIAAAVVMSIHDINEAKANNGLTVRAVPNSGTLSVGQSLEVLFEDPSNTTEGVADLCFVNNVDVRNTLENVQPGLYRVTYTVSANDVSRGAGMIPIDCTLRELNTIRVTAFDDGNTVAIDTGTASSSHTPAPTPTPTPSPSPTPEPGAGGSGSASDPFHTLEIRGIDQLRGSAAAGGNFDNGWAWTFRITMPANENSMQIKFSDWMMATATNTIPAAQNMRLSLATGTPVLITASNEYQSTLTIMDDGDAAMPGKQVDVKVEMQIPAGTPSGSYSTSYGIRTF